MSASEPRTSPATGISAIVLTFNESRNLDSCLASLSGWVERVFVVDSGSTDDTPEIARRSGAHVVSHPFDTHTRQWQWALQELPLESEWVLAIDADQRVTEQLRDAVLDFVRTAPQDVAGAFVRRRQVFRGRFIRYGGYYPKYLLKLFRRSRVWLDDSDLVDHHFRVHGRTVLLPYDLIEENRNELSIFDWTAKHNRYAVLQARQEFENAASASPGSLFGTPDERVLFLKRLWARLPLYARPVLYFLYRYVVRLGFLDGKQGFVFHVLQGFWYRLLVDINLDELRQSRAAGTQRTSCTSSD